MLTFLVVFDPTGKQLREIMFPGKKLTCPAWGGKNNDILFVTSAKDVSDTAKDTDQGGSIFRYKVTAGTKGKPENEFMG